MAEVKRTPPRWLREPSKEHRVHCHGPVLSAPTTAFLVILSYSLFLQSALPPGVLGLLFCEMSDANTKFIAEVLGNCTYLVSPALWHLNETPNTWCLNICPTSGNQTEIVNCVSDIYEKETLMSLLKVLSWPTTANFLPGEKVVTFQLPHEG